LLSIKTITIIKCPFWCTTHSFCYSL